MGSLLFITGPIRSGKSQWAVARAQEWGGRLVFASAGRLDASDRARLAAQGEREAQQLSNWRMLEVAGDPMAELQTLEPAPTGVIFDSLGRWLASRMDGSDEAIIDAWERQLAQMAKVFWPTAVLGTEVGWGPGPGQPMAQRFLELTGRLHRRTAQAAKEVVLVVAGCPLRLK